MNRDSISAADFPGFFDGHLTKADGTIQVMGRIHRDARIFLDEGTFFVGIQTEYGRQMIGWGETVKQAVDDALDSWEG